MTSPLEITVRELKAAIDAGGIARGTTILVDVREPWEAEICSIAGGTLMPLSDFPRHAASLDRDATIFVYCHHGGRSMQATQWLRRNGYARATNVAGGIHAWAESIEPEMAKY